MIGRCIVNVAIVQNGCTYFLYLMLEYITAMAPATLIVSRRGNSFLDPLILLWTPNRFDIFYSIFSIGFPLECFLVGLREYSMGYSLDI